MGMGCMHGSRSCLDAASLDPISTHTHTPSASNSMPSTSMVSLIFTRSLSVPVPVSLATWPAIHSMDGVSEHAVGLRKKWCLIRSMQLSIPSMSQAALVPERSMQSSPGCRAWGTATAPNVHPMLPWPHLAERGCRDVVPCSDQVEDMPHVLGYRS